MLVVVASTTRSMLTVVGRWAWAIPYPGTWTSVSQPRLVVQGTTTMANWRNSSTSSDVTTTAGRMKPASPRAGAPKSTRRTSPARIGDIAGGGVEHRPVVSVASSRSGSP